MIGNSGDSDKCILAGFLGTNKYNNDKLNGYYDATEYEKYYTKYLEKNSSRIPIYNEMKKFKESYFKCDKVEYDDKVDATHRGSGRIIAMYFSEITKRE